MKERFEKQKFTYDDLLKAVRYGVNYGKFGEEELNVPESNVQQWLDSIKTRTAEQWQTLFPEVRVIDPDGWDRVNHKKEWYEEQITYPEYIEKRDKSTCIGVKKEI